MGLITAEQEAQRSQLGHFGPPFPWARTPGTLCGRRSSAQHGGLSPFDWYSVCDKPMPGALVDRSASLSIQLNLFSCSSTVFPLESSRKDIGVVPLSSLHSCGVTLEHRWWCTQIPAHFPSDSAFRHTLTQCGHTQHFFYGSRSESRPC